VNQALKIPAFKESPGDSRRGRKVFNVFLCIFATSAFITRHLSNAGVRKLTTNRQQAGITVLSDFLFRFNKNPRGKPSRLTLDFLVFFESGVFN